MAIRLSDAQLLTLTQKYFGDLGPEVVRMMFAVARAESGGDTTAHNLNAKTRDDSHGLWQINVRPDANPQYANVNLRDPDTNAKAARAIYDAQGVKAWGAYNAGTYQKFLGGQDSKMTPEQIAQAKLALATAIMGPPPMPTGDAARDQAAMARYQQQFTAFAKSISATPDGRMSYFNADGDRETAQTVLDEAGRGTWAPIEKSSAAGTAVVDSGNIPVGYSFDKQSNTYFRNTPEGPVPVGQEEVEEAAVRQQKAVSEVKQNLPKGFQVQDSTGDLYSTDPQTGSITLVQKGFAAPQLAPGFTSRESARVEENRLKASQRANDLQAATDIYRTNANLIPAMGDLAIRESQAMREILSQGGDFIYRAFRSQGQDSPLPMVTQGDLMQRLRSQLGDLKAPTGPQGVAPADYRGYEEPTTPTGMPAGFTTAQPGAPAAPSMRAPLGSGVPAPTFDFNAPLAQPAQAPYVDAGDSWGGPGSIGEMPRPMTPTQAPPGFYDALDAEAQGWAAAQDPIGTRTLTPNMVGGFLDRTLRQGLSNTSPAMLYKTNKAAAKGAGRLKNWLGFAEGTHGFVTEPEFVVGDPKTAGRPNPEKVTLGMVNGRPAAKVEPLDEMPGKPAYARGTPGGFEELPDMADDDIWGYVKNIVKLKNQWDKTYKPQVKKTNQPTPTATPRPKLQMPQYATGTPSPMAQYASGFSWDPAYSGAPGGASYGIQPFPGTLPSSRGRLDNGNLLGGTADTSGYAPPSYINPKVSRAGFGNYKAGQPLAGQETIGNWYDSPYLDRNTAPGTRQRISGAGVMTDYVTPEEGHRALYDMWNRGAIKAPGLTFAQWAQGKTPEQLSISTAGPEMTPEQKAAQAAAAEEARKVAAEKLQKELLEAAERTLPPAIRRITEKGGGTVTPKGAPKPPIAAGGPLARSYDMPLPTLQELDNLTKDEVAAADSYFRLKWQTPLSEVYQEVKRRYAPGFSETAGRLRGPGL